MFVKKYPFINNFSYYFKSLNDNLSITKTKIIKKIFKKKILNKNHGNVSFIGSARMALYIIMKFLKIKKNDEIIVTAFTCSVVINAILRLKAKPIYVDINMDNLGMDIDYLKKKLPREQN